MEALATSPWVVASTSAPVHCEGATQQTQAERPGAEEGILRSGMFVAARRQELGISQRNVGELKVLSPAALVAFEKGRSWPRDETLAKLEDLVRCPRGTLAQIRYATTPSRTGRPQPAAQSPDTSAACAIRAVQSSARLLAAMRTTMPAVTDPEFCPTMAAILAEVRELRSVATELSRTGEMMAAVATLGSLHRIYVDLMQHAAQSPHATTGQRLYTVRHALDLSVEDIAALTEVPASAIIAAENEQYDGAHASALISFLNNTSQG